MSAAHTGVDWSRQQPNGKQREFSSIMAATVCSVLLSPGSTKMWSLLLELTTSHGGYRGRKG